MVSTTCLKESASWSNVLGHNILEFRRAFDGATFLQLRILALFSIAMFKGLRALLHAVSSPPMGIVVITGDAAPKGQASAVLIDPHGLPRYCATIWSEVILAGLASNTRIRHLYAVDRLYRAVETESDSSLDRALMTADFDAIEDILLAFHTKVRNEASAKGVSGDLVWTSVSRFVTDMLTYLSPSAEARANDLNTRLRRIRRLYGQLSPSPSRPPLPIRALPSLVVSELCEIFDPKHARNPFRSERERWRNYLIFVLLLHTGLRRSELAMLPVDAISSSFDVKADKERHWINVGRSQYASEDPRRDRPSLKTRHSARQLPVSEELAVISDLVGTYKKRRASHPFLFGSQKGRPLNLRSFQRVMEIATRSLSIGAMKKLQDRGLHGVTLHSLRHTCAVYRLSRYVDHGDSLDTACEKLRAFFGWSPSSPMPRHYGRAYFEAAAADDWDESYDSLVNSLRRFDGVN
jgi:integrase